MPHISHRYFGRCQHAGPLRSFTINRPKEKRAGKTALPDKTKGKQGSRASGRMTEAAGKGLCELSELAGNLRKDAAAKNRLYGILGALPGKEGILLQMLCTNESGHEQGAEALRKAENGGKEVYRALEDFHLMCSPAEEGRLSRRRYVYCPNFPMQSIISASRSIWMSWI